MNSYENGLRAPFISSLTAPYKRQQVAVLGVDTVSDSRYVEASKSGVKECACANINDSICHSMYGHDLWPRHRM